MASSVFTRGWLMRALQLLWVMAIGFGDKAIASSVVRSPEWETPTSIPTSFIALMIETLKSEIPPSTRSVDPEPIRFWLL